MSQLPLFFALQLVGSWACLAFGPHRASWICLGSGFLVGLAITVFLALPLLLLGVFTPTSVVALLVALLAVSIAVAVHRGRVTSGLTLRLVAWASLFTAVCAPFCAWNVAQLTYDSEQFIAYANQLEREHQLSLATLYWLHSWGSFQVVAHALATVTEEQFLYALAPAFSVSLVATLGATLERGLRELGLSARGRTLAIAIALGVLLAIPLVRVHVVYVHANWTAAGYLFLFAASFWLADLLDDASYLAPAFLGLLAFGFARVESPLFIAMLLPLVLSQTRFSRAVVLGPYLAFTLILAAWLLLMGSVVPDDSEYLSSSRSYLMAATMAAIFLAFLARDAAGRLLSWIPRVVAIGCVALAAIAIVMEPDAFQESFFTWQRDLWLGSYWGYVLWPVALVLGAASAFITAPPYVRPMRYAIALFFVLVVVLTTFSHAYSSGRFGGLTRLTLHVVPLLVFYLALVVAPLASGFWKNRFQ